MKSIKLISLAGIAALFMLSACTKTPEPNKVKAEVLKAEFIYESAPFPQCHASTIVETNGGFLAAWFGGTHERNPDVCIYTSALKDGKWSQPVLVADGIMNDTLRYPCWNPVLFKTDNGNIVLYYKVGPSPREWWGLYKTSADNGKTWSDATEIPNNLLGPIKNKPERLSDGTILYPTSFETREIWNIYVETSDQNLKNWKKIDIDNNGFNAIQPTILFHPGGKIQMLCRSRENRIVETWSSDNGKTWSPVEATTLVNNNSGIDAVTLKNGLQLLVSNPIEKGRNKLDVKVSADGKIWYDLIVLEDQPKGEFSYPAIIEGKDGTVHITYTYNRVKVKYVHLKLE
jgi:predicted neuraminidase